MKPGTKSIILVVDDEPDLRLILCENLSLQGYETAEAEDGEQAWTMINANPQRYAAIVLDRMMPRLDGMALLKRIKKQEHLRMIPVILQTALGQKQQVLEGLQAGASYYFTKPYDQQILTSVVATAVSDHQRHRDIMSRVHLGVSTLGMLQNAEYSFKTPDEAHSLAACLSNAFPNPEKVAMGLLEFFMNAVEHGNLELGYDLKGKLQAEGDWKQELSRRLQNPLYAEREVSVRVSRQSGKLQVEVEDMGSGFDWQPYLEISPERAADSHGRGIALARALSFDRVEYLGKGNRVRLTSGIEQH